jgi:hypothetical protein
VKRNVLFLVFSSVFFFFLFFLAPLDTDLGWHLRYGEYFASTLHVLRTNTLTYYLPGYLWQNSYALYQVVVYFIYKSFGLVGLSFACSILMTASYYFFAQTFPRFAKTSFFMFLLVTIFSWQVFNLGLRSQLFSFFFITLVLYVLEKSEANSKLLYVLPPIFLIWVNVHGAFPFGLFILFAFLLDKLLRKEGNIYLIFSIFALSFIVTLINPYGFGVYKEGLTHVIYPLGGLIAEWVPPNLTYKLIIIFFFVFTAIGTFISNSKRKFFWLALILFFTFFSITARRNLPYVGLIFAESLIIIFYSKLELLENNDKITDLSVLGLIAGVLYVLSSMFPGNYITSMNSDQYCNNTFIKYPCGAIQFLRERGIKKANIFANYEWGGYLEWILPENKYFVDGRMPTWKTPENQSPYTVFLNVMQAQPGYEDALDKYKTDILLIGQGSFLDLKLVQSQSIWKEIFRDNISVVYARKAI